MQQKVPHKELKNRKGEARENCETHGAKIFDATVACLGKLLLGTGTLRARELEMLCTKAPKLQDRCGNHEELPCQGLPCASNLAAFGKEDLNFWWPFHKSTFALAAVCLVGISQKSRLPAYHHDRFG